MLFSNPKAEEVLGGAVFVSCTWAPPPLCMYGVVSPRREVEAARRRRSRACPKRVGGWWMKECAGVEEAASTVKDRVPMLCTESEGVGTEQAATAS